MLAAHANRATSFAVLVYAVVDDALSRSVPLGDSLDVFIRREDAERFIEEERGDDPELASYLRIEEPELEGAGSTVRYEAARKEAPKGRKPALRRKRRHGAVSRGTVPTGLKIPCPQGRVGSTPTSGIRRDAPDRESEARYAIRHRQQDGRSRPALRSLRPGSKEDGCRND